MQQEIPPAKLSRLSSYDLFVSFTMAPLGAIVAGPAANAFGAPAVLAAGGLLIVLLTVTVLFIPEVRHMRRQLHDSPGQAGMLTPWRSKRRGPDDAVGRHCRGQRVRTLQVGHLCGN